MHQDHGGPGSAAPCRQTEGPRQSPRVRSHAQFLFPHRARGIAGWSGVGGRKRTRSDPGCRSDEVPRGWPRPNDIGTPSRTCRSRNKTSHREGSPACVSASSGRNVTCGPPSTTGMPRARHSSASWYPRFTVAVIVEMPTMSGRPCRAVHAARSNRSRPSMNTRAFHEARRFARPARMKLPSRGNVNWLKMLIWAAVGSMNNMRRFMSALPSPSRWPAVHGPISSSRRQSYARKLPGRHGVLYPDRRASRPFRQAATIGRRRGPRQEDLGRPKCLVARP